MSHFGGFLAWGNVDFYDVAGTDNTHYIYYYDSYAQRSIQGYYNPQTGNEMDFSDGYSEEEIQKLLSQAGFQVNGGSYSKIDMLYYDDLCQKTAPAETVPAVEKRNPPEISSEIKAEQPEYKITSVPKPSDVTAYMGKGTPDEGHLNIRSSRSTSSDIIAKIYVGEKMDVYYIDGNEDWRYVEFGSYSGYVMSKYVILTDSEGLWADGPESAAVYSCEKKGEINGRGVAGFTTSYVVNGGAKTTVRDELGNRWHVTAKNYCSAYGVTWYELWDSDDGDYYGWVDGNYISFYAS